MNKKWEVNFDGVVGPTHNYAGLALGNMASAKNAKSISNPKQAALQGLKKMMLLADMGLPQGLLPPHARPNLDLLKCLGFKGHEKAIIQKVAKSHPDLLAACYSSSNMWAANAATVSPSWHTSDQKTHITIANLAANLHRSQEASQNMAIFKKIFKDESFFTIHAPLPSIKETADEGAANHSFLESGHDCVELFVYGIDADSVQPKQYPARQTKLSQMSIARNHQLPMEQCVFLQQNPDAIDAGAFHNDVVCVGHNNVLLYHEQAFVDISPLKEKISRSFASFYWLEIKSSQLSLDESVKTYLFNSQIVTTNSGKMALIAPTECQASPAAQSVLEAIVTGENPIQVCYFVDCRQSMRNGGGPACLRLRVPMTNEALMRVHQEVLLDKQKSDQLEHWINKHYRESLNVAELADPLLCDESYTALDELTRLLNLGSIYSFQQV